MKTGHKAFIRDDNAQSKRFIEKAREIEADEGRSSSDSLLGRLAKMPPEPKNKNQSLIRHLA